jgi:uncharacterized protein (DUF58 family)
MYRRLLYRSYRQFTGLAYRLSRRLTKPGKFVLACLIVAAAFGLDTNQTTTYQAFTFLAVLMLVSLIWAAVTRRARGITVERHLPRFGTVGNPVRYTVTLRNDSARRQPDLTLLETLEDPRPTFAEFQSYRDWCGFNSWTKSLARRRPAVIEEQAAPDIPARSSVDAPIEFTPTRRGRIHFTGMTLARPDVFGLVRNHRHLPLPQSLVILPKRYRLPRIDLPGTREYQPAGVALAAAVGQSDEFIALRDYRPGDPVRHIHWSSVAKTDRLIVREHEDEFFVRHALILDTFGDDEAIFEEAVSVAASFVCTVQTQESLLDLLFVGASAYCFTAGRGVGHVDQMLEVLAGVVPASGQEFPALESLVLRHATRVSGCVCVFVKWDAARQRLIDGLRGMNIPVRVCVVTNDAVDADDVHVLRPGKIAEALARL